MTLYKIRWTISLGTFETWRATKREAIEFARNVARESKYKAKVSRVECRSGFAPKEFAVLLLNGMEFVELEHPDIYVAEPEPEKE